MSTTTVYALVKALQAAKGNIEKQAILDANKDNKVLKTYMKAVYDVGLNYYMKKLPEATVDAERNQSCEFNSYSIIEVFMDVIAGRKKTGAEAKKWVADMRGCFDANGQELMQYILDRKIGASVGDTMVLKTWPDLYFIPPYMRCSSMDDKTQQYYKKLPYFYVQTKRDGSFAYLRRNIDHSADVITRQGNTYPAWFADRMAYGLEPGTVLVGEMEVYEAGKLMSRKDGNGVLNSVQAGADESEFTAYTFRYVAWDSLSLAEFKEGHSHVPYEARLNELKSMLSYRETPHIELIQTWTVTSVVDANAIHIDHTKRGLEGTVWKDPNGEWKDTSSGTKWAVKNKVVFEAEYEITHAYEGEGKDKGKLGGIGIKTKCGKLVNNCGSGFSAKQREELWLIRDELPGMIVTLEANDITTARDKDTVALSLPIFIEIRTDKKEADTLERVYEQLEAAKYGRSTTK